MNIEKNILAIKQALPQSCKLIAVSKTKPAEMILEAYHSGQRIFGENKVQELCDKYEALPKDIEWHMIGHLQSNKVKYMAPFVNLIHGVDSIKLLAEIDKQGGKVSRILNCLLQVHIAKEDTKFGFSEDELLGAVNGSILSKFHNVKVVGLMGMASFTEDNNQIRNEFRSLKVLFEKIKSLDLPSNVEMEELSMGMSGDYAIAVEEGSTMVRIGSAIFGTRQINQY